MKWIPPPPSSHGIALNNEEQGCFGRYQLWLKSLRKKYGCDDCKDQGDCWKETGVRGQQLHLKSIHKKDHRYWGNPSYCIICLSGGHDRRRWVDLKNKEGAFKLYRKGVYPEGEQILTRTDRYGNTKDYSNWWVFRLSEGDLAHLKALGYGIKKMQKGRDLDKIGNLEGVTQC